MNDERKNDDQTSDLFSELNHKEKAEIKLNTHENVNSETTIQPLRDWSEMDSESDREHTEIEESKKKKSMSREIFEYVIIFAITILAVNFIHKNVFTPVSVDGESMEPTLKDKDYVFLWELGSIERFDIIVFQATENDYYVKRVIGLPGDSIRYDDDSLYINNKPVSEPYLKEGKEILNYGDQFTGDLNMEKVCSITNFKDGESCNGQKIPEGYYLVMGDNRPISHDSEEIGLINEDTILGKTKFILYPFNRFGPVE